MKSLRRRAGLGMRKACELAAPDTQTIPSKNLCTCCSSAWAALLQRVSVVCALHLDLC